MTDWIVAPNQTTLTINNGDNIQLPDITLVTIPYTLTITIAGGSPSAVTNFFAGAVGYSVIPDIAADLYPRPQIASLSYVSGVATGVLYVRVVNNIGGSGAMWWINNYNRQASIASFTSTDSTTNYYTTRVIQLDIDSYVYAQTSAVANISMTYGGPSNQNNSVLGDTLVIVPAFMSYDRFYSATTGMPILINFSKMASSSKPKTVYLGLEGAQYFVNNGLYISGSAYYTIGYSPPADTTTGIKDTGSSGGNTGGLGGGYAVLPYTGGQGASVSVPSVGVVPGNDGYLYDIYKTYKINLITGQQESFSVSSPAAQYLSTVIAGSGVFYNGVSYGGIAITELNSGYTKTQTGTYTVKLNDYESIYQDYNSIGRTFVKTNKDAVALDIINVDTLVPSQVGLTNLLTNEGIKALCAKAASSNYIVVTGVTGATSCRVAEIRPSGSVISRVSLSLNPEQIIKMFTCENLLFIAAPPLLNIYDSTSFALVETHIIPNDLQSTQICKAQNNRIVVTNSNDTYSQFVSNGYPYPSCTLFSALLSASGCVFDNYLTVNKQSLTNNTTTGGGYTFTIPSPYSVNRIGIDTSLNKIWAFATVSSSSVFSYDFYDKSSSSVVTNSQNPLGSDVATRVIRIRDLDTQSQVYYDRNTNAGNIDIQSYENNPTIELSLYSTNEYDLRIFDG